MTITSTLDNPVLTALTEPDRKPLVGQGLTLYLIPGLPGSGKTTHAKQMQSIDPDLVRVNKDDLRSMLHNSVYSQENERLVRSMSLGLIRQAWGGGNDVVVDDAGLMDPSKREVYEQIAADWGAEVIVIQDCMAITVEECIERDNRRANGVGETVIRQFAHLYLPKVVRERRPELEDCIVMDVDGCLARKHPERSVYDFIAAINDTSHPLCPEIVRSARYPVVVLTGRYEEARESLVQWLSSQSLYPEFIVMRPDGDYSKAAVFKKAALENILDEYNIVVVVDDDATVIAAAQQLGLQTLQPTFFE